MKIFIEQLCFEAILGIAELERLDAQKIIVDAKIKYNYSAKSFINYAQVAEFIQDILQKRKFLLIETALEETTLELKQKFPAITQIKLKISKPHILDNCVVGAKIKKNFKNI